MAKRTLVAIHTIFAGKPGDPPTAPGEEFTVDADEAASLIARGAARETDAEAKARTKAEAKARADADAKFKAEAEAQAKAKAEATAAEKARAEAEAAGKPGDIDGGGSSLFDGNA